MAPSLRLMELIGLAYDAALEPDLGEDLLRGVSRKLKCPGSIFFIQDRTTGQILQLSSCGLDLKGVREYSEYYVTKDVRLFRTLAQPEGSVVTERDLLSPETFHAPTLFHARCPPPRLGG